MTPQYFEVLGINSLIKNSSQMKIKFLLLIFIYFNILPSKSVAQCNTTRAQDSLTLMQFYTATNGASWNNTTGKWGTNAMNTWFGVTLNSSGRVIRLDLLNNKLGGTLPIELVKLCSLQVLNLSGNQLTGTIPSQLWQLPYSLTTLELSFNNFTGQIPNFIGGSLTTLNLGHNQFSGAFPRLDSCFYLTNVYFFNNLLSGSIPPLFFSNHSYTLKSLDASNNQLTGAIPIEIGNCNSLLTVNLSYNKLSGVVPDQISNIYLYSTFSTTLRELILGNNELTGVIPRNIVRLFQMSKLDLSNNQLTGSVPPRLDSMPDLVTLNLYGNKLTGTIPTTVGNLPKLVFLSMGNNQLTGTIPPLNGSIAKLEVIGFGSNQLTGTIPASLGTIPFLKTLDLGNNKLVSPLPTSLGNLKNLNFLALQSNQFSDSIPSSYANMDSLELFTIASNKLIGSVPAQFSKLKKLAYFDIGFNRLDSVSNFSNAFPRYLESPTSRRFVISGNKFTFDDIVPNMPLKSRPSFLYDYFGQDSIVCASKSTTLPRGENFTIALNIDGGLTSNVYRWFKDGKLIDKTNVNKLTLSKVQPCHAGIYSCQVTNPAVPSMVLVCPSQVIAVPEPNSCVPYEITTFPNPVENALNISIVSPPDNVRLMRLSNMLGQVIWSRQFDEGDIINGLSLDCGNFPNGSYFLSLYTEGGLLSLTKRVQVLKK
jgi:Leucine-rich repeat (LRR) protein